MAKAKAKTKPAAKKTATKPATKAAKKPATKPVKKATKAAQKAPPKAAPKAAARAAPKAAPKAAARAAKTSAATAAPKPAKKSAPKAPTTALDQLSHLGEESGAQIMHAATQAADQIERIAEHAAEVIGAHAHPDACEAVEEIPFEDLESVHEIDDRSPYGRLRATVAAIPDFADYLRELGVTGEGEPWAHADTPQLEGLERWGRALTMKDRHAGIAALVRAAQHGFPIAAAAVDSEIGEAAFRGHDTSPNTDGAPVELQIARAARWLDDPSMVGAVDEAFDRTRQLAIWNEELLPSDAEAYRWYLDVGQCCCAAILNRGDESEAGSYYDWPPALVVGRGLVMAVRGIRNDGADLDQILTDLGAALTA